MFTKRIQKVYINISNHMPDIDPSEFTVKCFVSVVAPEKMVPEKSTMLDS